MAIKDMNATCNVCRCYIGAERHYGYILCPTCGKEASRVRSTLYSRKHGAKPMSENRACSQFLGVHVAERVLAKVFKNVERMPNGNPGYDFVCGKGYKIDVKSACISALRGRWGAWHFTIKRNTTPDYFLCLAFDDRETLSPLCCWLIPGHVLNGKTGANISMTTLDKWDEYIVDRIDDITACCDHHRNV